MIAQFKSVDSVVNSLYRGVTFPQGGKPDYLLLRSLFHAQGRITPPNQDTGGALQSLNAEEFIELLDAKLRGENIITMGATEQEIERSTIAFHRVAHVFSSYHFSLSGTDAPLARGVNALQLIHDDGRWWILSLTWDRAKPDEKLVFHTSEDPRL